MPMLMVVLLKRTCLVWSVVQNSLDYFGVEVKIAICGIYTIIS